MYRVRLATTAAADDIPGIGPRARAALQRGLMHRNPRAAREAVLDATKYAREHEPVWLLLYLLPVGRCFAAQKRFARLQPWTPLRWRHQKAPLETRTLPAAATAAERAVTATCCASMKLTPPRPSPVMSCAVICGGAPDRIRHPD